MAWTAPRTWVTNEIVTAAMLNTHLRDNLLEAAPAKVTTAGDMLIASGAGAIDRLPAWPEALGVLANNGGAPIFRAVGYDSQAAAVSGEGTYGSFTDLASWDDPPGGGAGSAVTLVTGVRVLALWEIRASVDTAGAQMLCDCRISGATTVASSSANSLVLRPSTADYLHTVNSFRVMTLTAGTNTFTLQAQISTGIGAITRSRLIVIPF